MISAISGSTLDGTARDADATTGRRSSARADGGPAADRAHHHRARRQILDVREIQFQGAVQQAPLERLDVAVVEAAREEQRDAGAADRDRQDRGILARRREQDQHQLNHAAAHRVAKAIDADVDQRLRGPAFGRRHRRVEQLVGGAEERPAKHRFAAARRHQARQPRRDQTGDAANEDGDRRRAGRRRQAKPFEREPRGRRLEREREETRRRVIEREEPDQAFAAAEGGHRLRLEQVIRAARRRACPSRTRPARFRRYGASRSTRSPGRGDSGARSGATSTARAAVARAYDTASRRITQAQRQAGGGQHRQHRRHAEHDPDPLGDEPAHQTAERSGPGDLAEALLGRVRIEPFGGNEPEAGAEQRTDARHLQVDQNRGRARRTWQQQPLDEQHHRAQDERDRDERRRRHLAQALRGHRDEPDRHHGRGHDHRGQRRHVEAGEVQRVAGGFARDELRRDGGRTEHGGRHRRAL